MSRNVSILSVVAAMVALIVLGVVTMAFAEQEEVGGKGKPKVTLCHNGHLITVGAPAKVAHLNHGDTLDLEASASSPLPRAPRVRRTPLQVRLRTLLRVPPAHASRELLLAPQARAPRAIPPRALLRELPTPRVRQIQPRERRTPLQVRLRERPVPREQPQIQLQAQPQAPPVCAPRERWTPPQVQRERRILAAPAPQALQIPQAPPRAKPPPRRATVGIKRRLPFVTSPRLARRRLRLTSPRKRPT